MLKGAQGSPFDRPQPKNIFVPACSGDQDKPKGPAAVEMDCHSKPKHIQHEPV